MFHFSVHYRLHFKKPPFLSAIHKNGHRGFYTHFAMDGQFKFLMGILLSSRTFFSFLKGIPYFFLTTHLFPKKIFFFFRKLNLHLYIRSENFSDKWISGKKGKWSLNQFVFESKNSFKLSIHWLLFISSNCNCQKKNEKSFI